MQSTDTSPQSPERPSDGRRKAQFDAEVADATLLLDYAIANGVSGPGDKKLGDDLIMSIKLAQDHAAEREIPDATLRAQFQKAYRDLAQLLSPVTADTLKATSELHGVKSGLVAPLWRRPVAIVWSRKLSAWTLLFVFVALIGDWLDLVYGPLPQGGGQASNTFPPALEAVQFLLQILVPFTYGAIGACLALLKACQAYIHMRQFDRLRIPEYYNRMILGGVSGGIIVLLVHQIAGDDGTTVRFSAAALGFLAGYNNELLFGAIERISAALLPRIGIGTVRPAATVRADRVAIEDVSLKELLERHQSATSDDDKKLLAGLIQKIQNRLS